MLLLLGLCCSCAGDLKDPERFGFLVNGGTGSPDDAGVARAGNTTSTGGTGGSSGGASVDRSPPMCVLTIIKDKCALSGCHASGSQQVDLGSPKVEDRLIGKSHNAGACKDKVLVTTDGSPSLLLQKFADTPPCGIKMPLGSALSAADIACFTDWVNAVSKK